jgi:IS5 family transposase
MIKPEKDINQHTFFSTFEEQLDKKHPLFALANIIDWAKFEKEFSKLYHGSMGRPAKPIRLMVGLVLLKHIRNISDESVVEQWRENSYYQYFCGEMKFVIKAPCEASELVHFRKRIGEKGMQLIFEESIRIATEVTEKKDKQGKSKDEKKDNDKGNGNGVRQDEKVFKEKDVIVDTTVQEKNITYPTDLKLHTKIIKNCLDISDKEGVELRQRYTRTVKKYLYQQRFRKTKKQRAKALKAARQIKTIAGRLVRELFRKLNPEQLTKYSNDLKIYERVLQQKREDKNKIYSIHEPHTECISKGKEHKKYEFGNKVSIIIGKNTGIVFGALSLEKNEYDGHTLPKALQQFKEINGYEPKRALVDNGYKGIDKVGETEVIRPGSGRDKSKYMRTKMRKDHRKRSGVEAKISHLKNDFRMDRNYYKGIVGDKINVFLAAASMNFKIWMNDYKRKAKYFWLNLIMLFRMISGYIFIEKLKIQTA